MISGYMLDTSTCIDLLRGRRGIARERFRREQGGIHISTIVLYELLVGPLKAKGVPERREDLDALIARVRVVPFNEAAAEHAADIRADLEKRGTPIGPYDFQIAGHARSLGLTIVTGNLREFERVDGLHCETWFDTVLGSH